MKASSLNLISLFVLAALMTACGGETPSAGNAGNTGNAEKETAGNAVQTEAETEDVLEELGEHDFGGKSFTIAYCQSQLGSAWPYEAEKENGDLVNDAVYRRDQAVAERYNAEIRYFDTTASVGENVASSLSASVKAGDRAYDLGIGHMFTGVNALISEHGLYNFNELPYVDYTQPWWAQHLRDQLQVGNVLLLNAGDMVYNFCDCIYFNKQLLSEYQIEDSPYTLTEQGKWTWDRLIAMAKTASADLNGDGAFDEQDRYGYSMSVNPYVDSNWLYSAGLTVAAFAPDGSISTEAVISEKTVRLVNTMYDLVHTGNQTYLPAGSGKESMEDMKPFLEGRSLFTENLTLFLPMMRDTEIDFGIVPIPKLDEEQKEYLTMSTTQMMMLPVTLDDPEFVGVMLEALSRESHRTVNPAVYETSFSEKYLRDEKSYEMYGMIRSSGVYDFNWNFGSGNAFAHMMADIVRKGTPDSLASYYEKNRKTVDKQLEKIHSILLTYED